MVVAPVYPAQAKVRQNFHDPSISATRPELISKYVEPLTDPLWDRGLLHFYKSLQVRGALITGNDRIVLATAYPVQWLVSCCAACE